MREIRSRIAERKGIDLGNQQIVDLAARRLEAILAPQGLDPKLMEELRRNAGTGPARAPQPEPVEPFDEASLYQSPNGLVRLLRRLFRPLLSLLLNPTALGGALTSQAELAAKLAAREAEQRRRQSEWNALHYEILRRLVTDAARAEIDLRDLLQRVESLAARVDFADRRVGAMEQAQHQARPARGGEAPIATTDGGEQPARADADAGDSTRRKRRRRRGRRSGGAFQPEGAAGVTGGEASGADDGTELDESADAPSSPDESDATPAPAPPPPSPPFKAPSAPEVAVTPDGAGAPPVSQVWAPPSRPELSRAELSRPEPASLEPPTPPPAPDVAVTRSSDAPAQAAPPERPAQIAPPAPSQHEPAPGPPAIDPGADPSPTDR